MISDDEPHETAECIRCLWELRRAGDETATSRLVEVITELVDYGLIGQIIDLLAHDEQAKAAEDDAFRRRYPKQNLSVADARSLMNDEEFDRWCVRHGVEQEAAA